jgi:hypothetical protein
MYSGSEEGIRCTAGRDEMYSGGGSGIRGTVSPSLTQFGEISSVYRGFFFTIMIAVGLQKPHTKLESGANLVLL